MAAPRSFSFVGEAVSSGEVEVGIQQVSELLLEPGITVVGPCPEELQKASVVSAAASSKAHNLEAAQCFLAFLASPAATEAMKKSAGPPGREARRSATLTGGSHGPDPLSP